MPIVEVDGKKIEVEEGLTVLQACEQAGAEIPRFCYHERLEIAGNCRMCLVSVEKMPKPVASCAQPIMDGMVIHTNTPQVKKAREGVMEFLLINHPLDCPICDQAGECDLQDQSLLYGRGTSRYTEEKRAVEEKYMGPLIKTAMTRCIQCTRCVRFMEDVAGTAELGAINRGEDMEITTVLNGAITSELSGNIIDLCPVGALTSAPYAFRARPWELSKTISIDVMDAVGSNIRIDSENREVLRILPVNNDDINEEWISDKARFACDGLKYQRIDSPMIKENGKWSQISWDKAIEILTQKVKATKAAKIGAITGALTDMETIYAVKKFMKAIGSPNIDCRYEGSNITSDSRAEYLFNTSINGIENADFCLIIGSNPRIEAPILNARIRKAYNRGLPIALIGEKCDLTYNYKHLGENPWILKQIAEGQHPICKTLEKFERPMIIIGAGVFEREDWEAFVYNAKKLCAKYNFVNGDWNGYNILNTAASRVGALDLGFIPQSGGASASQMLSGGAELLFLFGADDCDFSHIKKEQYVVYVGHHGDAGAHNANLVLPAPAYTEKNGSFTNLEGKLQFAHKAVGPVAEAKEEWQILNEIAPLLGSQKLFSSYDALRVEMIASIQKNTKLNLEVGKLREFMNDLVATTITNYYTTNSIARASKTMAKCVKEYAEKAA